MTIERQRDYLPGLPMADERAAMTHGEKIRRDAGRHDWQEHRWQDECGVFGCGHSCCEGHRGQ